MSETLLTRETISGEKPYEEKIRPQSLKEYKGQSKIKDQLSVFLQAARTRNEPLDHILLYGPPGLGKTTLACVIAYELGVNLKITSGPALERAIDLLIVLKSLKPNDILFIDEIHRLKRPIEEILYPAMEDFVFHRVIQKGLASSAATIQLPHFTLIAATTRAGLIAPPLRDRFGIMFHLDFYLKEELFQILIRTARILGVKAEEAALMEIAARSRGTPRICNRLLKRIRDFATVRQVESISEQIAKESLTALSVDAQGLDDLDRKYLNFLMEKFGGGPVGLETMASALGEDSETLEEICEPYLLQQGFIQRTPRGRMAAKALAGDL
ncbi:MAG: Holliday junction branch migration DNA helicase RuvB [Firmicutes bacterium]|nr:Holliday junction branch migration DNA helicase RuvB [Bacillota bacterium]